MKRLLLCFALLLPMLLSAQIGYQRYFTNLYRWFEGSWWSIFATGNPPCYIGGDGEGYDRYHVVGVDSIEGHWWYQIHHDWEDRIYCGGSGSPTVTYPGQDPNPFTFRIREDSTGKIWKRDGMGTRLLYDFEPSIGVGDTLWMNDHQDSCVVGSMDTVYIGNSARKRYWCVCDSMSTQNDFVIEGVGTNDGFDNFYALCYETLDGYDAFICVTWGINTLVVNPNFDCGVPPHNPVGVEEGLSSLIHVQWNETRQELLVEGMTPPVDFQWEVLDMQGRVLCHGGDYAERIHLPDLAAGMYLFSATDGAARKALRFMKF
jgi:hypothetical protein